MDFFLVRFCSSTDTNTADSISDATLMGCLPGCLPKATQRVAPAWFGRQPFRLSIPPYPQPSNQIPIGIVVTLMFKYARFLQKNPFQENTLIFFFGYLAYITTSIFDKSGIIAILVCGIFMAHYNFYNLSPTGKISTGVSL